jgi:hypothetical protein
MQFLQATVTSFALIAAVVAGLGFVLLALGLH